jgi:hypothetical protein
MAMQQPRQSYSGMHVKGGLIRARFLYVVVNHGPAIWSRVLDRLPSEDRAALAGIVIDNWYPLRTLNELDHAIADQLARNPEEIFDELGEFSATSSLSGPYASLRNDDIHSFLKQSSLIHHTYQDFGQAGYDRLSDTSGLLTIKYKPAPPVAFCLSGSAYFRHAIELCGGRSVRISHDKCCGRGDDACEFYITWQR